MIISNIDSKEKGMNTGLSSLKRYTFLAALCTFMFSACGQERSFKQLNSIEFSKAIENSEEIVLDVRTPKEFKSGHIKNAQQLNFYERNFGQKLLMLPKDNAIYLYCLTGSRSENAASFLVQNGYKKVYNLQRGIMDWNLKNLPVIKDADAVSDVENKYDMAQYQELLRTEQLLFIDFYAPWCAPCRSMMPMIDSLKVEYKNDIKIVKINVDASKNLVKQLQIAGVPYLAFFKNGEMIYSKNATLEKEELKTLFDSHIKNSKR
ncbi:MAG: hypothetical protein K9H64_12385 [Bacteroidales bacterium]|nr:hypothetical protein [Bacteroidales bacterium]MCF8456842.1 hypothetical protein [Bacteroidales bacterium]